MQTVSTTTKSMEHSTAPVSTSTAPNPSLAPTTTVVNTMTCLTNTVVKNLTRVLTHPNIQVCPIMWSKRVMEFFACVCAMGGLVMEILVIPKKILSDVYVIFSISHSFIEYVFIHELMFTLLIYIYIFFFFLKKTGRYDGRQFCNVWIHLQRYANR